MVEHTKKRKVEIYKMRDNGMTLKAFEIIFEKLIREKKLIAKLTIFVPETAFFEDTIKYKRKM